MSTGIPGPIKLYSEMHEYCEMVGHNIKGRYALQKIKADDGWAILLVFSLFIFPMLIVTLPLYMLHNFRRKHLYDICTQCGDKWEEETKGCDPYDDSSDPELGAKSTHSNGKPIIFSEDGWVFDEEFDDA